MPENGKLLEETVFPSEEKTISTPKGGAYFYVIKNCLGFEDGKTIYKHKGLYDDCFTHLGFVRRHDNGRMVPGLQNEQLIIVLKDRIKKLDAKFPHPENENMLKALDDFLEASKRRVEERLDRGVVGELKK